MRIIMLGAPGSGKGTQSKMIVKMLNIPHISTGDIFRRHIKDKTPLGKVVADIIAEGHLVPDDITINLVKERLSMPDCKDGYVLDGFPRSLPQARALDEFENIDVVLNLNVKEETIVSRTKSRRVCKNCGAIINVSDLQNGKCNKCGGEVYIRPDDQPEAVLERINEYEKATRPLIDYYKAKNKLIDIDADNPVEIVYNDIMKALKQ
jgi:adenylate kinase